MRAYEKCAACLGTLRRNWLMPRTCKTNTFLGHAIIPHVLFHPVNVFVIMLKKYQKVKFEENLLMITFKMFWDTCVGRCGALEAQNDPQCRLDDYKQRRLHVKQKISPRCFAMFAIVIVSCTSVSFKSFLCITT